MCGWLYGRLITALIKGHVVDGDIHMQRLIDSNVFQFQVQMGRILAKLDKEWTNKNALLWENK